MPDDNGLETSESQEIAGEMRKRGKEKLSENEMQEVMDTVNPGFWQQWKATEKRVAVDTKHVKCDHCDAIVSVVRPSKNGKKEMCNTCATRLTSRERVISLSRTLSSFLQVPKAEVIRRHSPLDAPLKSLLTLSALSGLRLSLSLLRYPAIA
jgi:hypothetical protein